MIPALSSRIIDRIFSGAVTRGGTKVDPDKMSYTEFVWFLLSEEDKQHPTAVEYWFRLDWLSSNEKTVKMENRKNKWNDYTHPGISLISVVFINQNQN